MANEYNLPPEGNSDIIEGSRAAFDSALGAARQQFTNVNAFLNSAKQIAHSQLLKAQTFVDIDQVGEQRGFEIDRLANQYVEINTDGTDTNEDSFSTGLFLTNIFDNIEFESNLRVPNFFTNNFAPFKTIRIPVYLGTMGIQFSNNYSKTSTLGGSGTIKHFASSSELRINISGVFVSNFTEMDQTDVAKNKNIEFIRDFLQMCVNYKTVNIEHPLWTDKLNMNLNGCVIESFSLPDNSKYKNLQEFKISLITDSVKFLPTPELKPVRQ